MKEKKTVEADPVVSIDGVEEEVDKVIDATLREIQQRIGGTKVLKEYAKRLGAEAGAVATIAKGLGPDDPQVEFLKGKVKGLEHAMNVVREVVDSNDAERFRADGRVTAFRQVKKNIEAKREAAKANAERLKERGKDDGFREDGAPSRIGDEEGRGGNAGKKKSSRKKAGKKKASKRKTSGRK